MAKAKNAKQNTNYNIAELLAVADTQTATRTPNTAKLYTDGKINFAKNSGIENGKRYTAKIANNILLLYADENGKRKANAKGDDGIIVGITAKLAKQTAYATAVANGKVGDTCKEYKVARQSKGNTEYIIIDLQEHQPKQNAKAKAKQNAKA